MPYIRFYLSTTDKIKLIRPFIDQKEKMYRDSGGGKFRFSFGDKETDSTGPLTKGLQRRDSNEGGEGEALCKTIELF